MVCIENSPSFYVKYAPLDMCCGVRLNYVAFTEGLFSKSWAIKPVDRWGKFCLGNDCLAAVCLTTGNRMISGQLSRTGWDQPKTNPNNVFEGLAKIFFYPSATLPRSWSP